MESYSKMGRIMALRKHCCNHTNSQRSFRLRLLNETQFEVVEHHVDESVAVNVLESAYIGSA